MGMNTRSVGRHYEELAVKYLVDKGHVILEKNYRKGRTSEIDIISKDREAIVFTEVKYRRSEASGHPLESVNLVKQRRICEAARRYIYDNHLLESLSYRFDVVGIKGDEIEHIENAFYYIGR